MESTQSIEIDSNKKEETIETIETRETEEQKEKIQMILRQTNYTEEEAREKLKETNNEPLQVIKKYLGITEKKAPTARTKNQEIYRQIRNYIYIPPKNLPVYPSNDS